MLSTASQEFARLLHDDGVSPSGDRVAVGFEAEYVVRNSAGEQVDFRDLIDGLGLGLAGLDPGDVYARRLASSNVLTCDFQEAELALLAEPLRPGFTARIDARLRVDERGLVAALGPEFSVHGYTTHVSISVARHLVEAVAWAYAERFGPAAMVMMDGRLSPGFLVRPRAGGRVELCGWYLGTDARGAALTFAAGSVLACAAAVERGDLSSLPPAVAGEIEPGASRHGWYLAREAFGSDLYAVGRRASLQLSDGGTTTVEHHLRACWAVALAALRDRVAEDESSAAEAMVSGAAPLACDRSAALATIAADPHAQPPTPSEVARPRRRRRFDVAAVALTWGFVVFVIVNRARSRRAYALIPADRLQSFITQLDAGRLDHVVTTYLRLPPAPRLLALPDQTEAAALYDEMADRVGLLWPETEPTGTFTSPPLTTSCM